MNKIEQALVEFFRDELQRIADQNQLTRDSEWTDLIHDAVATIGHRNDFTVFATKARCPRANEPEWLYDHHWRVANEDCLQRIPLAMEIEWGYGKYDRQQRIEEDFLKLVQARADLRVMVFQEPDDVRAAIDRLTSLAKAFKCSAREDRYLFAIWSWAEARMVCYLWPSRTAHAA